MKQLKIEEMEYLSELESLKQRMDKYIHSATNSYERLYLKVVKTILSKEVFTKQVSNTDIQFDKNIFGDEFFESYIEDTMINNMVSDSFLKFEYLVLGFKDYLYERHSNVSESDFLYKCFHYKTGDSAEKERMYHDEFHNLVKNIVHESDSYYSEYVLLNTLFNISLGTCIKNDDDKLKARKHFFDLIKQTNGSEQFEIVEEENTETGYTEVVMLVFPS